MTYPQSELANIAVSTIASPALTTTTNTLALHSGDGALFPSTTPFLLHIGSQLSPGEIVVVTARSGDSLTIQRGQNGTQAQAWGIGVAVQMVVADPWGIGTALASLAKITATGIAPLTANAAVATATSGTIATAALAISRVSPTGAITAVVLQAGTVDGQVIIVENDSTHSVTFDIAGNSNVADGSSDAIAALTAVMYIWNATTALWYKVA